MTVIDWLVTTVVAVTLLGSVALLLYVKKRWKEAQLRRSIRQFLYENGQTMLEELKGPIHQIGMIWECSESIPRRTGVSQSLHKEVITYGISVQLQQKATESFLDIEIAWSLGKDPEPPLITLWEQSVSGERGEVRRKKFHLTERDQAIEAAKKHIATVAVASPAKATLVALSPTG